MPKGSSITFKAGFLECGCRRGGAYGSRGGDGGALKSVNVKGISGTMLLFGYDLKVHILRLTSCEKRAVPRTESKMVSEDANRMKSRQECGLPQTKSRGDLRYSWPNGPAKGR